MSGEASGRQLPRGVTRYEDGSILFAEFEEGDPRRGPHSLDVQNEADALERRPGRWHRTKRHVDWLAVRLAIGRGYSSQEAAALFGIDDSQVRKNSGKEHWVAHQTERDRRELSVMVWLAGWLRLSAEDIESRDTLKRFSEWRARAAEHAGWRDKDPQGEPLKFTINDEIPDDAYFSEADPQRDERRSALDGLEARLRELEAEWEREAEQERLEREAADQHRPGEIPDRVAAVPGGMGRTVGGADGVAGVGAAEPASA